MFIYKLYYTILTINNTEVKTMPNATISVYLSDDEYLKYIKQKEQCNEKAREAVKKELER